MPDTTAIYDELSKILSDIFERTDIVLSPELSAKDVKGWDSFKQVEILIASEERFGIKFTSTEVDSIRALGDLVAIVADRGRATI